MRFFLRKEWRSERATENKIILNSDMFKSVLPQRVLRELANNSDTLERMVAEERSIGYPAFEYFHDMARKKVGELE